MTIIDVGDPMNPTLLTEVFDGDGSFSRLAGTFSVFVSGITAYVASRFDDSLTLIDVSDPMNPVLLAEVYDGDGTFSRLDAARSVVVSGTTAYVAASVDDSLTLIDVGGPPPDPEDELEIDWADRDRAHPWRFTQHLVEFGTVNSRFANGLCLGVPEAGFNDGEWFSPIGRAGGGLIW